jgi:hypothetical protein
MCREDGPAPDTAELFDAGQASVEACRDGPVIGDAAEDEAERVGMVPASRDRTRDPGPVSPRVRGWS